MEFTVCPLHVSLSRYCAQTLLSHHADSLPDLTSVTLLAPNQLARRAQRAALLESAQAQGQQALLLPQMSTLRDWVLEHDPTDQIENRLCERLDLVDALKQFHTLRSLSEANPWSVASELLHFFEQLRLNNGTLPEDPKDWSEQLQQAYGITQTLPTHFSTEAQLVYQLWKIWDADSGEFISAARHYQQALQELSALPNTRALYVCGYDQLAEMEVRSLERLSGEIPVHILARTQHRIPQVGKFTEVDQPVASAYAALLRDAFAIDVGGPHLKARAESFSDCQPQSPLEGRLCTYVAPQAESHARGVEIQIRRWLQEDRSIPIGLVTEDRKLARRIRALLERASIEIADYSGWTLSTTSAATIIKRWIDCMNENFQYAVFLEVLKSPFLSLSEQDNYSEVMAEFEHVIHRFQIHAGLGRYREAFEGSGVSLAHKDEILRLLQTFRDATKPLNRLPNEPTGNEFLAALLQSLESLGCLALLADDEAGEKILDVLERTHLQLQAHELRLPRARWHGLLQRLLEQETFIPKTHQKYVTLINLEQAHLSDYRRLIVAGMDARHYPGKSNISFLFNDAVRHELGLPSDAEERQLYLQRFLALVASSDQVLLTYQKSELGRPCLPSIWFTQIETFHRLAYPDTSLINRELAALSLAPEAEVRPYPLPELRRKSISTCPRPSIPFDLLPRKVSANAHQNLIDCPYQFYVKHILRLRETRLLSEKMDHLDFGIFVHNCLQAFHTDVLDLPGPWQGPIGGHESEAITLLEEIGQALRPRFELHLSVRIYMERWSNLTKHYIYRQSRIEEDRTVTGSEETYSRDLSDDLTLHGRLDRLDRKADGKYVVVDYKTGMKPSSHKEKIQSGEALQLSSYALMLDEVEAIEYWWLGGRVIKESTLSGESLNKLCEAVRDRLLRLYEDLRTKAGMPANGDRDTCDHCQARGVCRKGMWEDRA